MFIIHYFISQIPGFLGGLVIMALFYYRHKTRMDAAVEAAQKETAELIAKIKAKANK